MFYEPDEEPLLNLGCVLLCFQVISGLNVNLTKFELVTLEDGSDATRLAKVLGCKRVELPIKCSGMPLSANHKDVRM